MVDSKPAVPASVSAKTTTHIQPSQQKREIPFGTYDNILLVGEGDFSFTRSLAIEHGCANVVGTSFDSEEEVMEK
jgi:25S rRNA (uracil2634-N3)-methyltransferase